MKEKISIKILGEVTESDKVRLKNLLDLDHARFNKNDVIYDTDKNVLVIKLRRHEAKTKARKKILGFTVWYNRILPTKNSILTIKDVESCDIRDEDPKNPHRQEVLAGGIVFQDDEIYIGAFCEHENPYGITVKTKTVNITLEDKVEDLS
jgi:hypothetical protein